MAASTNGARRIEFGDAKVTLEEIASVLKAQLGDDFGSMDATPILKKVYQGYFPQLEGDRARMQFPQLYSLMVDGGYLRMEMIVEGKKRPRAHYYWK